MSSALDPVLRIPQRGRIPAIVRQVISQGESAKRAAQAQEKVYNGARFVGLPNVLSGFVGFTSRSHAEESCICRPAAQVGASRRERDEERACAVFEFSRWLCDLADQWQDLFRMQCGECFVWHDELRGAYRDLLCRCTTGTDD